MGIRDRVYVGCMVMISIEQEKNRISIQRELEKQHFQVEALTDSLTGVGNRQALQQMMDTLAGEGPEPEYSMACLLYTSAPSSFLVCRCRSKIQRPLPRGLSARAG